VVFVGVFVGILGGVLFVAIRRWLPARAWRAGLVYGFLLLVALAPIDPLSRGNGDFEILHPVGLAVLLVAALFPLYGLVVAALVARLDRTFPDLRARPFAGLVLLPLILAGPAVAVVVVAFGVAHLARSISATRWQARTTLIVGRVLLALVGTTFGVAFVATARDLVR
jgi:hypothetical protein